MPYSYLHCPRSSPGCSFDQPSNGRYRNRQFLTQHVLPVYYNQVNQGPKESNVLNVNTRVIHTVELLVSVGRGGRLNATILANTGMMAVLYLEEQDPCGVREQAALFTGRLRRRVHRPSHPAQAKMERGVSPRAAALASERAERGHAAVNKQVERLQTTKWRDRSDLLTLILL